MDKITLNDFQKEQKKREIKEMIQQKYQTAKEWAVNNKAVVAAATPVVLSGITKFGKFVGRRVNLRKQEQLKTHYCYDRSLGHYWKLKRELRSDEWLEIDRRKRNGEKLSDILAQMRVLD